EVVERPNPTVPEEELPEFRSTLRSVLDGTPLIDAERRRRRADGSGIDARISVAPLRDAAGEVYGAIEVAADITQSKRAAEQIRLQVRRLETLRAIDLAIMSSLDLEDTLQQILHSITALPGVTGAKVTH